ncbi:single-stranded DNA-binding protein [bacterium SCSIO 12741]|nr:single-stranded DNA-binding protein [bacterium SCSIO 12741]
MKNMKNKVQLIGRLGQDPEVKQFNEKNKLAKFSIATTEKYKDAKGKLRDNTIWHNNIVAWGKLAGVIERYLKKGSEVAVEGRLQYRRYEDGEGKIQLVPEVVISNLLMLRTPAVAQ